MALVPPQTQVVDFFFPGDFFGRYFFFFFIKMIHRLLDTELS